MLTSILSVLAHCELNLFVNFLFKNNSVRMANHESWNVDAGAGSIVCHNQKVYFFISFVINNDSKDSSKGLDVLSFHNKMASSSHHHNYRCMFLFSSFFQMFTLEMFFFKRFAPINVRSWIMKPTSHSGAVVELTEVSQRRSNETFLFMTIHFWSELPFEIWRMKNL